MAHVKDGAIVLDGHAKLPPEGSRLAIEVLDKPALGPEVLKLAGSIDGYPEDFAKNHDHYIHGTRKKP